MRNRTPDTPPHDGALIPFAFEGSSVRAVSRDGEPWFVLADVCRVLEHSNPSQAASRLDDDEKGIISGDTPSGAQDMLAVNESGLYSLILTSRKPAAKRFKKWVTAEVLPTIRKTGGYTATPLPPANPYSPEKIAAVREARLTFGRAAAQKVWHTAGLPPVSPLPEEPRQSDLFTPPTRGRIASFAGINKPGRKPILTDAVLAAIDARIQAGATKRAACEAEGVSYETMKMAVYRARMRAQQQH